MHSAGGLLRMSSPVTGRPLSRQGYPVASITVPTERSAHYGLRPPPAGSPTTMGAAAAVARPPDSVFVHARQTQLAQQAAIAQQQQQVMTVAVLHTLTYVHYGACHRTAGAAQSLLSP